MRSTNRFTAAPDTSLKRRSSRENKRSTVCKGARRCFSGPHQLHRHGHIAAHDSHASIASHVRHPASATVRYLGFAAPRAVIAVILDGAERTLARDIIAQVRLSHDTLKRHGDILQVTRSTPCQARKQPEGDVLGASAVDHLLSHEPLLVSQLHQR